MAPDGAAQCRVEESDFIPSKRNCNGLYHIGLIQVGFASGEDIMQRLLYISTARERLSPAGLEELLRVSRRKNAAFDISGLLLVGGRRFLQALEGPREIVYATYERIKADDRHFGFVVLADNVIKQRSFAQWAMGYQPSRDIAASGSVSIDVQRLLAPIADATLRSYFSGFADQHAA